MTTINEAMKSLYEATEGKYTEHLFSGVRRKFLPSAMLTKSRSTDTFALDTALIASTPEFVRDTLLDPID